MMSSISLRLAYGGGHNIRFLCHGEYAKHREYHCANQATSNSDFGHIRTFSSHLCLYMSQRVHLFAKKRRWTA